jgi:hypothetical protein
MELSMTAQRRKPVEWNQHWLMEAIKEGIPMMPGDSYRGSATKGGNRYSSKFGGSWINFTAKTTSTPARWRLISYTVEKKKGDKQGIVKHFSRQRTWKMTDIERAYVEAEALAPTPTKVDAKLFRQLVEAHREMASDFEAVTEAPRKLVIKTGPASEPEVPAPAVNGAPEPRLYTQDEVDKLILDAAHEAVKAAGLYTQDEVNKLINEAVQAALAAERERYWNWYVEFSAEWAFNSGERLKMEESLALIDVGPPMQEITSTFKVKKGASLEEVRAAMETLGFREVNVVD